MPGYSKTIELLCGHFALDAIFDAYYAAPWNERAFCEWAGKEATFFELLRLRDDKGEHAITGPLNSRSTLMGLPCVIDDSVTHGWLVLRRQPMKFCAYCGGSRNPDGAGACRGCGARE